jgi:lysophospholipase L1-like esterase
MVQRLKMAGIKVVLMTEPKCGEKCPRNGLGEDPNLRLARYMEISRSVARDAHVPLVDHFAAWDFEQSHGRILQAWTTDGCHPNPAGHSDLAQRIAATVAPLLP